MPDISPCVYVITHAAKKTTAVLPTKLSLDNDFGISHGY